MTQFDVLSRHLNPFRSHFLEASAGTGKTFAIEHVLARLLIEGETPFLLEEILVVTFTRAATRELKARIHRNLKRLRLELETGFSSFDYVQALCEKGKIKEVLERVDAALISYDRANISTLHGFCYRLLKEFGFEARVGPLLADPDKQDASVLMEKWVRRHLKEANTLASYSPVQIQQMLKKYRQDPARLISALTRLTCEGKSVAKSPSYSELLQGFVCSLQSLPAVEASFFIQDMTQRVSCYTKMTSEEIPSQIALLAQIVASQQCTPFQFDQLLKGESILEKMREENLKKRAKPLPSLQYPQLLSLLQMNLLPWITKARDSSLTLLRLSRELQEKSREIFDKEDLFSPDALLLKTKEALLSPLFVERARKKFKAAIIDEFQDTDPIQWSIVKTLFLEDPRFTLYLVGDPKQSIYAFRSADVYVYLDAAEHMGQGAKKYLNTNFRSTPPLVEALNRLFSGISKRWMTLPSLATHLDVVPVQAGALILPLDAKPTIEFFVAWDKKGRSRKFPTSALLEKKVYPYIASEMISLHSKLGVAYDAIAVLVKDRFQGQELVEYLSKSGIPSQMQRGVSLAESEAALSLKDIVSALYSPSQLRLVKRALATPLIGWTEALLCDEEQVLEAKAKIKKCQDVLFEEGFGAFFHVFLSISWQKGAPALIQVLFQRGDAALYLDLRRLCEWIVQEESQHSIDYLELIQQLLLDSQGEDPRLQAAPLEEKGAVKIMTIHRSKGLEFDVVFALGLGSRHPPSDLITVRREGKQMIAPLDESDVACQRALEEIDAEKQRLLYVSLTRARKKLYIPLFLEEEKQTLRQKEASPIELFLAHFTKENGSYEELYSTVKAQHPDEALSLLKTWEPHVSCCVLQEAPPPSFAVDEASVILPAPSPLNLPCKTEPLLSFTALADQAPRSETLSLPAQAPLSIHTLPLGVETGLFVHHLFEMLFKKRLHHPLNLKMAVGSDKVMQDFDSELIPAEGHIPQVVKGPSTGNDSGSKDCVNLPLSTAVFRLNEKRIEELLFGIVAETPFAPWVEVLIPWVLDVLKKPLLPEGIAKPQFGTKESFASLSSFSLADIPSSQLNYEMEFLYPCQAGLMKGFADLFFEFEGKYYILDWKTNYLGPSDAAYTQEKMREAIHQHQYDLQASIYAEALKRYVKLFDNRPFADCFGGAFYYFVRGKAVCFLASAHNTIYQK